MAKAKSDAAAAADKKRWLMSELAPGKLIAELLGTFALTWAILNTTGNAIVAALAVLILVLIFSKLSGAYINPAITIGMLATKQIGWARALGYLVAQFLGAMLAAVVATQFLSGTVDQYTGEQAKLFSLTVNGDWKPFFAELLGALIFGFGLASTVFGKKEGFEAAFTIGGSLLIGLVVATAGSHAILNPAIALSVGALDLKNIWGLYAYTFAPVIGVTIGMLLFKLLQSDMAMGLRKV